MEQLEGVLRALLIGVCVCGVGIGVVVLGFLAVTGRGIWSVIQDALGVGQRDEEDLIDQVSESIQTKRQTLRTKRDRIVGDSGIPDFDAAVAKYSQQGNTSPNTGGNVSAQSAPDDPLNPNMRRMGSGSRFDENKPKIRRRSDEHEGDYEIDDYEDFLDE